MSEEIGDDVREAMETLSKSEDETKGPERDEEGKFVAKQGEGEVEAAARLQPETGKVPEGGESKVPEGDSPKPAAEGQAPTEGERILKEDKAPRGWTPAAREKWGTIPPDIREEILRREEASAVGVRQLQERYAPVEGFMQSMA